MPIRRYNPRRLVKIGMEVMKGQPNGDACQRDYLGYRMPQWYGCFLLQAWGQRLRLAISDDSSHRAKHTTHIVARFR